MKQFYWFLQRPAFVWLVAVWLAALSNHVHAQQQQGLEQGVFRIKVTEELAQRLENARYTKSANNVLLTGIKSIDLATVKHKVSGIKRVFRQVEKFEAKHRKYGLHRWYEVEIDKADPVLSAIATFRSIEQIEKVEPVYKKAIIGSDRKDFGPVRVDEKEMRAAVTLPGASNDPLLPNQWHYDNTGQAGGTPGSDISLFQAWGLETGKPSVIVAVTDGGAQVDHPDLAANMWVNTDEIPGNNIDDDGNGYIDDINGYGFGDNTGEIAPDDHGTHTSGTIAAVTNNGLGVAGVAGGSGTGDGVRIMSCAAFGASGTGGFAETYIYGADNGAVISQNSWGYTNPGAFEQAVLDAIDYFIAEAGLDENGNQVGPMRGGIVIFAAGNSDSDEQHYPGYYEPTLAVSGVTNQDKKAWYSNFGAWVDVAGPGGETFVNNDPKGVLSTVSGGQYAYFQGTSMACPHVSGIAALIISKFGGPGLTPQMVRGRLVTLVDDIDAADPDFAGKLGSGRVNAFSALQEDDGDAPEPITELEAADATITSVTLYWEAPSDPGNGSASAYDIRYSTSPITEANFSSATAVPNPPTPKVAGTPEIYTVTGLQGGTTYYFAIKSADFFGNYSLISNVVQQATAQPPVIAVSPTALTASLETAETSTQTLTISNTGQGTLNFSFSTIDPEGFVAVSPDSASVAPGDSLGVAVTIDASGLLAGTYEQALFIISNDPLADTVVVPVTLTVINNGAPIASVEPDTLDFGPVFETGSKTKYITLSNAGSDSLVVSSITSDNADFTTNFTSAIVLGAFQDTTVNVIYTASSLGSSSGTLSIATNDPQHPTLTVFVLGEGVVAPSIEVSPDSLADTLNTDKTSTKILTVKNTGGSNLEYSVSVAAEATATVAVVKTIAVPAVGTTRRGIAEKSSAIASYPNQVKLKSVGQLAAVSNVLILTPDNDVSDVETILDAYDDIEADVYPKADLPSITLADLEGYDIVFATNNTQWLASGGVEPSVIGDLLADYIDEGGKVIVNQFAYSYDAWKLEGRFIDDQYGPFIPSTTDEEIVATLGDILAPGHPLLEGVSELEYTGYVQNVSLAPGATAVAAWDNDELFLAANGNVVALNLLPSLGNGGPLQWTGDLATLYENAVHYLSGASFVSVSPSEGIVAPGTQVDLEVTFDASGLDAGIYTASIDIASNAPNQELVSVPATLTVLGPEFTVTPDSLVEELEKDQTVTRTLVLKNNGPDDHNYTVTVQGGMATASVTKITLPATQARSAAASPAEKIKQNSAARQSGDYTSTAALHYSNTSAASRASVVQASTAQYATDFESFASGDITDQEGWFGQWGNWTIESTNPFSGSKHLSGLADALGQSLAFSPVVAIGTEAKSTVTAKLNIQGTGVTWQIIPQSPTEELVNTRIQFGPDGVASALVSDGAGGGGFEPFGTTPSGYFDLTIEVDRDSAYFYVYIDDVKVFTGQGFAGNIEQLVLLSLMEEAGPTLDLDDVQIIDGVKEDAVNFLTVSPTSGSLPSGASVELQVTFNSTDLEFGKYSSAVNIDVDGSKLTVPATLTVVGDPAIKVSPTVLQAIVDYKEDTTQTFKIWNTGGRPLTYSLQVIGAATDIAKLPAKPVSKFANAKTDKRLQDKVAKDIATSKSSVQKPSSIQILTGAALFEENFEDASFPPSGWNVVDNAGNGVAWDFAAAFGESNYAGTGEAATASSDAVGEAEFDTELITPVISTAGYKNIAVQYNANYQNYSSLDFLDLDIQVDGGAWTTVLSWNEDHGILREGPGEFVTVPLGEYLNGGATSFRLRWHYYDPNTDDYDWYAQIDDVVILGDARAWVTVNPATGTVPVQGVAEIQATFDASDIEPGSYVAGILVSSNATEDPLIGVVASLTVREPAIISVDPDSLHQELPVGGSATQTLTISNSGPSTLKYAFGNTPVPDAVPVISVARERKQPTATRTTPSTGLVNLRDARAFVSRVPQKNAIELYVTGFEEFAPGDIDGQEGWEGQWSNWTIESENPFEGAQHFRGLADGLGQSLAFSPVVAIGTEPISSTSLRLNVEGSDVTWQIIPQSPTAELVNTRFQISPDGSLSVLVQDSLGSGSYQPIDATLPSGYFEFRIDVERATAVFTIYIDGVEVFTGQGFAGDIEQVVILSLMEEAGPTLDIDNLAIFDGAATTPWLAYNPKSGTVPPGGSATVTVTFNAKDLLGGIYTDSLSISSNDPDHSPVIVPVTLHVIDNYAPVLGEVDSAEVIELGSLDVTFTATDADGDFVTIQLLENLPFITPVSSGNGTATYNINPALGHAGEYDLPVIASDSTGAIDSATFHVSIIPYGVESFSLVNIQTGQVLTTFTDSATLDVGTFDLYNTTIRANTNPGAVGSVRFIKDGTNANLVNTPPYNFNPYFLYQLTTGTHTLRANAYTRVNGTGTAGKSLQAVVHILNSSAVTDLDVVRSNGVKLADLADSSVIDISKPYYDKINIRANAGGSAVKSVVFELNGVYFRTDNNAPYALNGNGSGGSDTPWPATPGVYTLTATPYSYYNGTGSAGIPTTVTFEVVNGASNARLAASDELGEETGIFGLSIYPVPVQDELTIRVKGKVEGNVGVVIHNTQGIAMFSEQGEASVFRNYKVSTSKLGLTPGVYFVQVQLSNGKREIRKFIKE